MRALYYATSFTTPDPRPIGRHGAVVVVLLPGSATVVFRPGTGVATDGSTRGGQRAGGSAIGRVALGGVALDDVPAGGVSRWRRAASWRAA